MTAAIEFSCLSAGYAGRDVVRDVSGTISEGEMAAVIGPNGAGKTTLLRVITGLVPPGRGDLRLFGRSLSTIAARDRASLVGVVPQSLETPMAFTVEEIVTMGRSVGLSRWRSLSREDRRRVERAMAFTDTVDMRGRLFSELSGGEQQRVVIAMVLAQEPRILLMDEATSHLDINHRIEIMQIVERLNHEKGVTVLMVSHDLNLASEFCRRLLLMDNGEIVADGPAADVLTEERLGQVYHCKVHVQLSAATGSVNVLPAPRLIDEQSGRGLRIHIVCGGGSGEVVMRRLLLGGYEVTCGVLNRGDSDAEVAAALDVEVALERPFSPIGEKALAAAETMADRADALVVCAVPFGPGNVVNLDLAERVLRAGKPVLIMGDVAARDYTRDHAGEHRARQLNELGAVRWETLTDLTERLPSCSPVGSDTECEVRA